MINDESQKERIREKLNFFYSEKVPVHIKKHDKEFLNGKIISRRSENIFMLEEVKKGLITVFVQDVFDVEEFREVGV